MIKIFKIGLEKKHKYIIQSLLIGVFTYIITQDVLNIGAINVAIASVILVVSGALITHYPGINGENIIVSLIMPLGVLGGALLSLRFYPNLGFIFKLFVILFFSVVYYLVSLADNVMLVVHDREEIIPLYRVAVTWSQILQVIVAIPLFAGIFKLNLNAFIQSLFISMISIAFSYYQLWIYRFEPDAKKTEIGEILYLCLITFFVMFFVSFSISFFPSEAFLRALFMSTLLLSLLTYISAYLKNEITRKMIIEYLVICLAFLFFLIFFTP